MSDIDAASTVWHEGLRIADRYLLDRPVSSSPSLPVWRGIDQRLRRPVEIRGLDISAAADQRGIRRVQQRLLVLSGIEHDALVRIFDAIVDDGWLLIISEAHDAVAAGEVLPELAADWRTALATAHPAISALAALHDAGALHRRISRHAVLITEGGMKLSATDHVRQLLARSGRTTTDDVLSTDALGYLAPEIAEGGPASLAADVYAAGVVLWEMVAGRAAGDAVDEPTWQAPLPALTSFRDVPDEVDRLVRRATARDPADRHDDATQLAAAVETLLPARPERLASALARSLLVAMHGPDGPAPRER